MEELLKLLKEYAPDYCKDYPDDIIMDEIVISKRFGFVEWLCSNDKIDLYKAKGNSDRIYYKEYGSGGFTCSNEEFVLMLLAIQDKPIEFLISILK